MEKKIPRRLEGKVAIVIASTQGIGFGIIEHLCLEGASVVVSSRKQPSDIEARIRTMILAYIKKPNCLILAVTPAYSELTNSDALQTAGNADHDGNKTIGISFVN